MQGTTLGPYRIDRELGSGGMGTVWRAHGPDGVVALKVVHEHVAATPGFLERFLREGEVGRTVRHENVVATLAAGGDSGRHWIALEYVEGQTLRGLLGELTVVPEELCRHIGREVAKGLAAIHAAGLVHRDLKPENVLLTKDHVVKVMDLGIARSTDDALRMTQTGTFLGSVQYAAPEQFGGAAAGVDGRADLHALGVTLYELATGVQPFDADDVPSALRNVLDCVPRRAGEVNPQISAFFEEVLRTLVEKDRENRFASAAALCAALERGEDGPWWHERAKSIRAMTRRPLRRIRIPRETALYGRGADIARLRAAYEAAKQGEGQVVLVEGEAGIGKSRLVDEVVGLLQSDGEDLNFLFGGYPPGGAATASGAFSTAYREHFGVEGLEDALRAALPGTPLLVPAFSALLRGDATPRGAEPLTKDSLQTAFVRATQALAAGRPTIVLVEDLHFAPDEGLALFAALALALHGHRVLLVGTSRPGLDDKWLANLTRLGRTSRLALARLSPADLVHLLRDSLRSEHLAEELAGRIGVKSDGNPYFVFEILRGLREGQFVTRRDDGTWATTRLIREIEIPPSITELIQARIADLSDEDRNLLEVAACAGFEFDAALAGAVLGLPPIPSLQRFGAIEKRLRLVRSAGRRHVFDHHQVQEALYAGTAEPLREEYHAAIAGVIEARSGAAQEDAADVDGALAVELADHLLRGRCGVRALRYLDAAFLRLEKTYRTDAAIRLADHALADAAVLSGRRRADVLLRKANWLEPLGRPAAHRAALDEALAIADEGGDPALRGRARNALGVHFVRISSTAAAAEHLRAARVLAHEGGDRATEIRAVGNLGIVFSALGRTADAQAQYEESLALAREAGDRTAEGNALANLGNVCVDQGRYEEAMQHRARYLEICRELSDRRGESYGTAGVGGLLRTMGRTDEARSLLERALALAREIGDRRGEVHAIGHLGSVAARLGRLVEARDWYERNLALAQEMGERESEAIAHVNLGPNRVQLGDPAGGRAELERSLAICRATGNRRVEGYALHGLGEAARDLSEDDEAFRRFDEAVALRREIRYPRGLAVSLAVRGALHAQFGHADAARRDLAEARDLGTQVGLAELVVSALAHLATLPGGDAAAAEAALAAGGDGDGMDVRFALWRATSKREHLAAAKRHLDLLLTNNAAADPKAILGNVPLHRRVAAAAATAGM